MNPILCLFSNEQNHIFYYFTLFCAQIMKRKTNVASYDKVGIAGVCHQQIIVVNIYAVNNFPTYIYIYLYLYCTEL